MSLFVVTYVHPDAENSQRHLQAHVSWQLARLADGILRASCPFVDTDDKAAMLILQMESRERVQTLIATDPFVVEGLVTDLTIKEWNPIFGDYNARSTHAGAKPPAAA